MMSFFKSLFGGQPKKPMSTSEGLEKLEERADMLTKRIAHFQQQINDQQKIARENANTNKIKALGALKKKKTLEDNMKKAEAMLENIEDQKNMLENASSNAAVLKTMAETAKIVKQEHDNLDINKVEDIIDDIREQKEVSDEIGNLLSSQTTKNYDEENLLKELEGMQQEQLDAQLKIPDVPDVPITSGISNPVPSSSKPDELDELKIWASAAQ